MHCLITKIWFTATWIYIQYWRIWYQWDKWRSARHSYCVRRSFRVHRCRENVRERRTNIDNYWRWKWLSEYRWFISNCYLKFILICRFSVCNIYSHVVLIHLSHQCWINIKTVWSWIKSDKFWEGPSRRIFYFWNTKRITKILISNIGKFIIFLTL